MLICLLTAQAFATDFSAAMLQAMQSINEDSLRKHLAVLGSDSLQGRGTGSRGGELAAQYIADELAVMGLTAGGDQGSYFQAIPMHGSTPLAESRLSLFIKNEQHTFELGTDYLLFQSGAQTFIPNPVPLVFAGYGIIAPEFDYNDYQSVDVAGKVVVYLSGEPASGDSSYFAGLQPTIYSYPEAKRRLAISRGARGCILIPNHRENQDAGWEAWRNEFAFEDITLAYAVTGNLSIVMNPASAAKLFDEAPFTLEQVFEWDRHNTIRSFPLTGLVSFHGKFKERDFIASNVIATLAGKRPQLKDTYLLLSAHYDHLGVGPAVNGDSIYNGVLDNAIGVAGLLEIARVFAGMADRPDRSLIFLFVTGEEKGLLGSTYYLDHPLVPHYQTAANINIDGLAALDCFHDLVGVGAELSTLGDHLQRVASTLGYQVSAIPPEFLSWETFARSDQIAFAKAGIPSILITEGLSYRNLSREEGLNAMIRWMQEKYHTPFDDLQQPICYPAAVEHCRALFVYARTLADAPVAPEWKSGTPYVNMRLQSIAEKR